MKFIENKDTKSFYTETIENDGLGGTITTRSRDYSKEEVVAELTYDIKMKEESVLKLSNKVKTLSDIIKVDKTEITASKKELKDFEKQKSK